MKAPIAALVIALAAAPLAAFAQTAAPASPPMAPPPGVMRPNVTPEMRQSMRDMAAKMATMRTQEKAQILAALTPAHKQLLATIAGGLALGTVANVAAGAQQLDAALTPAESQAIIAADTAYRTQRRSLLDAQRQQITATLPQDVQDRMRARAARPAAPASNPDAGLIVMRATVGGSPELSVEVMGRVNRPAPPTP